MKNLRLAVAVVISVVVSAIVAGLAHAYPDSPNITITLPSSQLYGGDSFTFTVSSDVDCAWTVTYPDGTPATQTGQGRTFSGTFTTKTVDAVFKSPITATCVYTDETGAANQTASASATVTLLPRGASDDGGSDSDAGVGSGTVTDDDEDGDGAVASGNVSDDRNGALPDTGGSSQWVLILGGALLVAGGGAVVAARRRHGSR